MVNKPLLNKALFLGGGYVRGVGWPAIRCIDLEKLFGESTAGISHHPPKSFTEKNCLFFLLNWRVHTYTFRDVYPSNMFQKNVSYCKLVMICLVIINTTLVMICFRKNTAKALELFPFKPFLCRCGSRHVDSMWTWHLQAPLGQDTYAVKV